HPLLLWRHGGPLGGAISALFRQNHSRISQHGFLGSLRIGLGIGVVTRLRRHARSQGRSRRRRADVLEWLPAVGLPTNDAPPRWPAGLEPRHAQGHIGREPPQTARQPALAERNR